MQWKSYMPHYYNYYATIIVKKGNYAWRTLATLLATLWSLSGLKRKKNPKNRSSWGACKWLILLNKLVAGGRIWTYDLQVMSLTKMADFCRFGGVVRYECRYGFRVAENLQRTKSAWRFLEGNVVPDELICCLTN